MRGLKALSISDKQVYAALCLHRFCKAKGIEHPSIDELVDHLISIKISSSPADWECKGAALALCGRGDPLPESLAELLPEDVVEDFVHMVEFVVEVGLVDMYGALTTQPMDFLMRCVSILDAHGVERPVVTELFEDRGVLDRIYGLRWGETISPEQYVKLKRHFD